MDNLNIAPSSKTTIPGGAYQSRTSQQRHVERKLLFNDYDDELDDF